MKLQQLIRRYKNQTHQTNEQLAKQFHVSENTVSRWLRGEVTSLQEETAHNVSAVLGFDVSAMLKGKAITLKQPVLGHVKAGYDLFLESDYLGEESVSDEEYQQGDFFLRISGNSMVMDGISDGSAAATAWKTAPSPSWRSVKKSRSSIFGKNKTGSS